MAGIIPAILALPQWYGIIPDGVVQRSDISVASYRCVHVGDISTDNLTAAVITEHAFVT